MKNIFVFLLPVLLLGCVTAPDSVTFNGASVGTYSAAAGCGKLQLDKDCSQMSGSKKNIEIDGVKLRIAGGGGGKVVFIMSEPKFLPDEEALKKGAVAIENFFASKDVQISETKVMYGSGKVFGVHYTLNKPGYEFLNEFAVQ